MLFYAPPTPAQHTSTIETITNLIKIGAKPLVHQEKDGNSRKHSETRAGASQAEECSNRAFAFVKAVLEGTVDNGETFPRQFVTPTPPTEMQKMTALVISKPDGAAEPSAYLTPRGASTPPTSAPSARAAQRKNRSSLSRRRRRRPQGRIRSAAAAPRVLCVYNV